MGRAENVAMMTVTVTGAIDGRIRVIHTHQNTTITEYLQNMAAADRTLEPLAGHQTACGETPTSREDHPLSSIYVL